MSPRPLILVTIAAGLLACTRPAPPDPSEAPAASADHHAGEASSSDAKAAARKPPEARRMYRLDFTFTSNEAGKAPTSAAYTLNLEENSVGEIRLGSNIPLQTMPVNPAPSASAVPSGMRSFGAPRQDVGFLLRCSFNVVGEDLLLHSDLEMSSSDQQPVAAIHKMTLKGDALVSPGKSAVVSTSEDPTTHQHYQLSVSAAKLR